MDQITAAYEQLIQNFTAWARTEDNIRAAVVIGSRARSDHPADQWSDLDMIVIAIDPQLYSDSSRWLDRIGRVRLTFVEPTPDGRSLERRALFEGGLDVDFALTPLRLIEGLLNGSLPADVADTFRRGMRVLLDKDQLIERLQTSLLPLADFQPPSEVAFLSNVNDFWYHAVWSAKHLRRGELWWAKSACDDRLKYLLREMLEWQARALKGPNFDTWLRGRFLEEWADPRAVQQLPQVFAHYDRADLQRALLATMELYRWLAVETAQAWHFAYPAEGDDYATQLVNRILV
jgi:aminoglycoside 6-adenylyltransferase